LVVERLKSCENALQTRSSYGVLSLIDNFPSIPFFSLLILYLWQVIPFRISMSFLSSVGIAAFIVICSTLNALAQASKPYIEKGDKYFSKGNFKLALESYFEAEKVDSQEPKIKFKIGQTYLSIGTETKALPFLEEAYRKQPAIDPDIDYYLGIALQASSHFKRALEHFEKFKVKNKRFKTIANHKMQECRLGDSLMRHPVLCVIKVLEWPINSIYQDYGPVLNSAESHLIFTSARDTLQVDNKNRVYYEDIMSSTKKGDTWQVPAKISPTINDQFHDAATYLVPDGKSIFLYYEKGNGDIYQSDLVNGQWTVPVSMGTEINTVSWETSGCLSPDKTKFFFTSDRPGGFGNLDIYMSEKLANGSWGKAVNLGPTVNTAGSEDAPFLHPDGTLYFGSDGHLGLGNFDIFKSEFKDGKWKKPVNLGYPINSPKFENYFFLSDDKKRAYFSAIRDEGVGNSDICMITFLDPPPPVKEEIAVATPPTVEAETIGDEFVDTMVSLKNDLGFASMLIGKVIDAEMNTPLKAQIIVVDNIENKVIERVYSNSVTGEFKIIIPHGGNYGINTSLNGYLFNSLNFEVPAYSDFQEIETHILMVKATVGSKAVLKNIFFDLGKVDLKNESIGELESVIDLLERNPGIKLQINGHTDNSGDAQVNKELSLKRAESVLNFLIKRGIEQKRLRAVGYGEERPIVSNDDEQGGREVNRRTEIEVFETEGKGG
jgi:outer membrane protein OmpA-like peptidoglycan-associated protein/tetratricopeptide (TPR) repeat protein